MQEKKLGIALGGGGPRGIAHIGALKAITEAGIKIHTISGTSVGALVAALFAFDIPLEKQKALAESMSWWAISKIKPSRLGLVSNQNLENLLTDLLAGKKIEEASIPLSIMTCDIEQGCEVLLTTGDVTRAIMASSAIPGIFTPITIDDTLLVDGGVIDNIPVRALTQHGAEVTVGIDLLKNPLPRKPKTVLDIISNAFYIQLDQRYDLFAGQADINLRPDLPTLIKTDKASLDKMYDIGYKDMKERIPLLLQLLESR